MDRRLTTIVAADLVGYSRLMATDEEDVIRRLKSARAEVIDPAVTDSGGRIIKTMGDGLLVEFPSPVAAVRCVIGVQEAMALREAGSEEQRLRFRVGINLGDIVEDGDDILGDGVNVAARLESLAPPGGICVSRTVHDQLRGKIGRPMTSLGPQMVKNMPDPVDVWRVEIEGAAPVRTRMAEPSAIAVLPFDNMSADPEQEFLADGIVEDVITELSRFRSLLVIARNSTFSYKGAAIDVRRIAKELGVRYVVEGSVRRGGNRIRVTAQLIDAETGAHVWADRWDRDLDDLFAVQDEMTSAIVSAVEPELGAHERKLARARPPENLTAWELYQRGIAEQLKYTNEGLEASIVFFNRALESDQEFALAHAALARTQWNIVGIGRAEDPAGMIRLGIAHASKAVEIDDRLEQAHMAFGVLMAFSGKEEEAISAVERAVALNPNNADCHHGMAMTILFQAQPDGARMSECERTAIRLNPRDPRIFLYHFMVGVGEWVENDFQNTDEALAAYREVCRQQNAGWFVFVGAAGACADHGLTDAAQSYLNKARELQPGLSVELYRTSFQHPSWPLWFEKSHAILEKLVELGLPRD